MPFGEPSIQRGEEAARLRTFALLVPQLTQAHRRPQLTHLRRLAAGHIKGSEERRFRLLSIGARELGKRGRVHHSKNAAKVQNLTLPGGKAIGRPPGPMFQTRT